MALASGCDAGGFVIGDMNWTLPLYLRVRGCATGNDQDINI